MESLPNVGRKKWVFKVTAPQNEGNKGIETQNCGLDWRYVLGDYSSSVIFTCCSLVVGGKRHVLLINDQETQLPGKNLSRLKQKTPARGSKAVHWKQNAFNLSLCFFAFLVKLSSEMPWYCSSTKQNQEKKLFANVWVRVKHGD